MMPEQTYLFVELYLSVQVILRNFLKVLPFLIMIQVKFGHRRAKNRLATVYEIVVILRVKMLENAAWVNVIKQIP